jgi:hypothetical protein
MKTLRKLFCLLALAALCGVAAPVHAQLIGPGSTKLQQTPGMPWQLAGDFKFTSSSAASAGFDVRGISYYRILFVPTGTMSACTLSIDSATSVDVNGNLVTPVIGGIVSAATIGSCASAGSFVSSSAAGIATYAQITPTITGTGSVIVVLFGYVNSPGTSTGASSVTITGPVDGAGNLKTNCEVGCAGGSTTPADAFANPSTAGLNFSLSSLFNGTTWDRLRSAGIGNTVGATGIAANSPYCEFLSSLPTLTNGTYGAAQCDAKAQLFVDLNYLAGTALGAPSAYGTGPGAVNVPGVNAFVTNTVSTQNSQTAEGTAAWTSATSVNTALAQTVTGLGSTIVTVNQGSTITGGVLTFEASDTSGGTNWYPVQAVQVNGFQTSSTYTLVASTNQAWDVDVSGWVQFRVRLSTAISGTATVNVGIATNASSSVSDVTVGFSPAATILSGQQAVTASAVALASNALARGLCVEALSTNTISVFAGPSGVTTSTGIEITPGASYCPAVANSNAIFVIASSTGASITWSGN